MTRLALVCAVAVIAPSESFAEPVRPLRAGFGVGGYTAITGPAEWGPAAEVELYPAGSFGRLGLRIEARGFESVDAGMVTSGVTYEVGASRPRLVLALHADAGVTYGDDWQPVVGGGVHVDLFLVGPLAIGADSTAMFLYDGVDSTLALGTALTLRLGI